MTLLRDPATRHLVGGPPQRWPIIAALLVLLALVGTVATVLSASSESGSPRATASIEVDPAPPVVTTAPLPAVVELDLPQPSGYEGLVPIGYPATTAGAVAAAYGYSRVSTGLDVEPTLRTIEAIADPDTGWFARERDRLADGLVEQRRELGLAPVGPVGSVTLAITPSGYQVLGDAAGSSVTVLTLNIVSATSADGVRTSGTVVLRWALRWDGERWRATALYSDSEHDALAVTPMTSQARALGWQVARGG